MHTRFSLSAPALPAGICKPMIGAGWYAFKKLLIEVYEKPKPMEGTPVQTLTTNFRRAVRIYDWLKYGHKKTKSPHALTRMPHTLTAIDFETAQASR